MMGRAQAGAAPDPDDERVAARRLESAWRSWCLVGLAALLVTTVALWPVVGSRSLGWALLNLVALVAVLAFVRHALPRNRRAPAGPLLGTIGLGNHATIARGVLISQLPGYLLLPWPVGWQAWLPALTFTSSLMADYLDGYFARRADHVTDLGEALDIEFDGLGLMAATALAVHYGQLPLAYFASVGCARYIYLGISWMVRRAHRRLHPLPPSTARRGLAGVTMELGAAALWPIVPAAMMTLAAGIVAVPFLAGFARDGAVHLGWVNPASKAYRVARRAVVGLATVILPPVLRLAIVLLLAPLLRTAVEAFPQTVEAVSAAGLANPRTFAAVVIVVSGLALLLIGLGFAGRTGAVAIVIVYGLSLSLVSLTMRGLAAWGCAFAIYIFGTGPASLWQPERALYLRRAGERA